ncbi:Membrane-anchored ribosome-binding protein, inhibits growth in stationary phase, ElaB/YqjD/DUF883 family [Collimonas sp. OK607]|uniref:DUF883 family protein n=1 Tax=Collimonas sp. OK607 TaxID=1798194 RepID=UPI0008F34FB1|nr:DUF883 family protein [Collimonas sp. OK607]SFB07245.1 Membrane-anchored ribosome-binding protein, inhibits growth in stationary phase, ElaB/YqjD/DUF883 family [Collimonas sp. OK607]
MLEKNLKVVNDDVKKLIKDAQALLLAAADLTGDKAEEMRNRGMRLLDKAVVTAQDAQANAIVAGREMADSAEVYVRENPWRALATAAGVGFLAGVILAKK